MDWGLWSFETIPFSSKLWTKRDSSQYILKLHLWFASTLNKYFTDRLTASTEGLCHARI